MTPTTDAEALRALAGLAPSYPEIGATAGSELPVGYRSVLRTAALGAGRAAFERACAGVLAWGLQHGAGLAVAATGPYAAPGADVLMTLGRPPLGVRVPCRVIYVVDEPDRRGFAYGTLPGHPERGEEAFVVGIDDAGVVTLTVRGFSRPATAAARLGGPLTRLAQDAVLRRYLAAARRIAAG